MTCSIPGDQNAKLMLNGIYISNPVHIIYKQPSTQYVEKAQYTKKFVSNARESDRAHVVRKSDRAHVVRERLAKEMA